MFAKDKVLIRMCYMNYIYKKDVLTFLKDKNYRHSIIYKNLIEEGYIEEKEIQDLYGKDGDTEIVCKITKKGQIRIEDKYGKLSLGVSDSEISKINKSNLKKATQQLNQNKIKMIFSKTDTIVFNKPPLDELFALKHAELLERGLYYSRTEFFEYLNSQSDARADQFYGSRFQGVYVNSHHACLVYLAVKKQIRLDSPIESRAIYEVRRRFCAITEVPEPEAIVFTPSVAMMYNMAINGKHGHDAHDEKTNLKSYVFLNNTCELFDHIYVFPRTFEYEESLQEFCGRTHAEREQFTVDLFKSLSQFELYSYAGDEEFMGYNVEDNSQTAYIPFFDIKLLWKIYKGNFDCSVIVPHDYFAEPIAHAVRNNTKFYDLGGNRITTQNYSKSGYLEGIVPPVKKRKKSVTQVNFQITKDVNKEAKKKAEELGISYSKLIRKSINKFLDDN